MPRSFTRTSIALALVLALIALAAGAIDLALFAVTPIQPGSRKPVVVVVARGTTFPEVTRKLVDLGLIRDARRFRWLSRLSGEGTALKAGEYGLTAGMSPWSILGMLSSGVSMNRPVTILEGQNLFEIADRIEATGLASRSSFLTAAGDPTLLSFLASQLGGKPPKSGTLEGFLYPETYFFNRAMPIQEILRQMIRKASSEWSGALEERASALGLSRYEAVTLASVIEKETGAGHERALISSVFHNRLRKRMRLQSDPTTIYGIWKSFTGNLRRSDLSAVTPYNTYAVDGLPVGPIGNPGREALQAALYPAESGYLYFVSHNDGTHEFSRTFEEHRAAVRRFQLDPKARRGKSWRDLNRSTDTGPR